jgi:hypothetical protein
VKLGIETQTFEGDKNIGKKKKKKKPKARARANRELINS